MPVLKLNIASLSEGHAETRLSVTASEIALDDYPEYSYPISAKLDIEKIGRNIFIKAGLQAQVDLICDRCAESFSTQVEDAVQLLYTTDQNMRDREDEDVFVISETTDIIDIENPVRETLVTALPVKRLCKEDCRGLCPSCGTNLNVSSCDCQSNRMDPRWEKLQQLFK